MGAVRITSLNPKFNGCHFGLPPSSSIHRMTGWVANSRILWRMRTAPHWILKSQKFLYAIKFRLFSTECTNFSSARKSWIVCDTILAVWKILAYKSSRTQENEIFSRTKISAITVMWTIIFIYYWFRIPTFCMFHAIYTTGRLLLGVKPQRLAYSLGQWNRDADVTGCNWGASSDISISISLFQAVLADIDCFFLTDIFFTLFQVLCPVRM